MTLSIFLSFFSSLLLIFIGIILKVSTDEKWRPYKKYWLWLIIFGSLLLVLKVYKYLL
jgi:hypothetical protein